MTEAQVIVVGGGPAGSTCAWKLKEAGIDAIVLDKQLFPRVKPCAGWITPRVVRDLRLDVNKYPHSLTRFNRLYYHFGRRTLPLPTRQYAIRRIEFDQWLLERAAVTVHHHTAAHIRKEGGCYIIDDAYRSRYLVGAGGTYCPVYRSLFKDVNPRAEDSKITAMEAEFPCDITDERCHLWFLDGKLSGYSWYVPKRNGFVNIGIGGNSRDMEARGENIQQHWDRLIRKLKELGLLGNQTPEPRGYNYYLRSKASVVQQENVFIIGDAAALATKDMGEGIGPAVRSGILAASAILHHTPYSVRSVRKLSLFDLLMPV
jgi:flavin-dependent dehydrogenase